LEPSKHNLYRRFYPNLLYRTQPFTKNEGNTFTNVVGVVFERVPRFKEFYCDPVVILHASATLVNSASFGNDLCCIHIDVEFIRLADQILNYAMDSSGKGKEDLDQLSEIADRVIFHSIMRTGAYNLLNSFPELEPLKTLAEPKGIHELGMAFLVLHEAAHLGMMKDNTLFKNFKEGFDGKGVESMINGFKWIQYDYGIFLSQLFKSGSKYNKVISHDAIKNSSEQLLTEIFCDQIALISTAGILQISMQSIARTVRSIAIMQCLSVLLHMTERMIHYDRRYDDEDGMKMYNITLRETVFNSWQTNFFLTFTEMDYKTKEYIVTMVHSMLELKFKLFDSVIRTVGKRLKNYILTEGDIKPTILRNKLEGLGYKYNYENFLISFNDPKKNKVSSDITD
jgi:hypothetical protein